MLRQLSPNRWSCLLTSFAMALDIDQNKLVTMIGHDGSQIIWPNLNDPFNRRAFHPQELLDCVIKLNYFMLEIELSPASLPSCDCVKTFNIPFKDKKQRFNNYLHTFSNGVLVGHTLTNKPHAVAWDGLQLVDPNGDQYAMNNFRPSIFYALIKHAPAYDFRQYDKHDNAHL